ncbi:MAG: PQQ-like beta-propeller repeat protein [Planctomycetes bacterium]|nr:PQQ-like beta-propeller repeat protein [Planctomycetota bacterium]
MRTRTQLPLLSMMVAALPLAANAHSADWPNWRGPNHDGISSETGLRVDWEKAPNQLWERNVGDAFSSFACVDGRLYTCGTRGGKQVLYCLAADTGQVLWERPFEKEYRDRQGGDGTRGTPTVAGGHVYVLGGHGRLICCNIANGDVVWGKTLKNPPRWGYSGSVLIEGNLAIVSAGKDDGALVAFDKKTGAQVWKCGDDLAGYATPYPFTLDEQRFIVGFLGKVALIAEADTGREVWRMPWVTDWDVNASSPIFHDGHLFISSGYGHGCILLKLARQGDKLTATTVWESTVLRNKFQSCVLHEGHLYAADEKELKCVEFLSGTERWKQPRTPHATVLLADGHLYVLTEKGTLLTAAAVPGGFEPVAKAKVLDGRCWTVPVLCNGRLYVRNLERVVCLDMTE